MTLICGVDEAGRGPLIGPMVMAGVLIKDTDETKLKAIGVKDSKLLTHEQRESMFERIKEAVKEFYIVIVPSSEVDDAVFGKDNLNLNRLEAKKTAEILNRLKPQIAYIDCPSTNTKAYNELLKGQLKFPIKKLITEHKADQNYAVASAASILAKVTRDREIEKIKDSLGVDFGSGYMSDPKTAEFLKKHHSTYKEIFRQSWAPYQKIAQTKHQKNLSDFSQYLKK